MSHKKKSGYFKEFQPALVKELKNYSSKKLMLDIQSGLLVGIIALPLSLALAIASGASPIVGLITAIIGGGIAAFLSGSSNQICGPTAAFIPLVLSFSLSCGPEKFLTVILLSGIILIVFGLLKLGKLINYISLPIISGFTCGIAVSIFFGQLTELFGYNFKLVPSDFLDKISFIITSFGSINFISVLFGVGSLILMFIISKINKQIPSALIVITISIILQSIFKFDIATINSRFGNLSLNFHFAKLDFSNIGICIIPAISIAFLASIESLLSAKAADNMAESKHNSNMELISQGFANIASSIFGGLPVTGAIARTSANIKGGAKSPLSGIVHAITILLIGLFLMPFAKFIPLTVLSAVLIMVCKNMINVKEFKQIVASTKKDKVLFFLAIALTVVFNLVISIFSCVFLNFVFVLYELYKAKKLKLEFKPQHHETEEEDKTSIKINGVYNFFNTPKFNKYSNDLEIHLENAQDIDLQGYINISELINKYHKKGKTIKIYGKPNRLRHLLKINNCDKHLNENDYSFNQDTLVYLQN